jgi:hypothetical protein
MGKEKQAVLRFRENRFCERVSIPVDREKFIKLEQKDMAMSWRRLREYCAPVAGLDMKNLHIVLDDRWQLPVSPYKNLINQTVLDGMLNSDDLLLTSLHDTDELTTKQKFKIQIHDKLALALIFSILFVFLYALMTSNIKPPAWMMGGKK